MINSSVILIILTTMISCSKKENTLVAYIGDTEVSPYDIHASSLPLATFSNLVFGRLIEPENEFGLSPSLLKSFQYDPRQNEYTLEIREDVKFHNRRKANSKDLEFSILRGFFSKQRNFYDVYLSDIEGIEKIDSTKFESGKVKGLRIINDTTVVIKLKNINPSFLHNFTYPYFSLVPIEELESDYFTWKRIPIGAGLYNVRNRWDGSSTTLAKRDSSSGMPSSIILTSNNRDIKKSHVSIIPIKDPTLESFSPVRPDAVRLVSLSNQNELGRNPHFRRGLKHLFDRSKLNIQSLGLSPLSEALPNYFRGRTKAFDNYNREMALNHFKKIPAEILSKKHDAIIYSGKRLSETNSTLKSFVEKALNDSGINITVKPNPSKFVDRETAKDIVFRMHGLVVDHFDPLIMFSDYISSGAKKYFKPTGLEMKDLEDLYEKAKSEDNLVKRLEVVKDISNMIQSSTFVIPLAEERNVFMYNPMEVSSLGNQNDPSLLKLEEIRLK